MARQCCENLQNACERAKVFAEVKPTAGLTIFMFDSGLKQPKLKKIEKQRN